MPRTLRDIMRLIYTKSPRVYTPPSVFEKAIFETPFIGPFLRQKGGWRGKLIFLLFKVAGEIPIAGGFIESLGRRHGIIAELPTAEHRNLLKIIAAREGARLMELQPVSETGKQYVFISPKLFRRVKYQKIIEDYLKRVKEQIGETEESKFYYVKRASFNLPKEQKVKKYVKFREKWFSKLPPKTQERFRRWFLKKG